MKILIYLIAFFIAAFVNMIIKDLDIAYSLAVLLSPNDVHRMALLAGLFGGIFGVIPVGFAYYFATKINIKREGKKLIRERAKFKEAAAAAGLSEFEYAKGLAPMKVITYCDSHLDRPIPVVTEKLDQLPGSKVISRACADALIEGYTKLMEEKQKQIVE